jgi:hypothetical protein
MNLLDRIGKITSWVAHIFSNVPNEIKDYAGEAIKIVQKIKEALESNTSLVIVDLIPGTWDNELREKAAKLLDEFLYVLGETQNASNYVSSDIQLRAKGMVLFGMASTLVAIQDGNKLPQNRYDTYTQIAYSHSK